MCQVCYHREVKGRVRLAGQVFSDDLALCNIYFDRNKTDDKYQVVIINTSVV